MTRTVEPIAKETAIEIHRRQIERHGGMSGLGYEDMLAFVRRSVG